MWHPFAPVRVARCRRDRKLVEAFVIVPTTENTAVLVQVIVPACMRGYDWGDRAKIAAQVTVAAVRARLLSQQGDPE